MPNNLIPNGCRALGVLLALLTLNVSARDDAASPKQVQPLEVGASIVDTALFTADGQPRGLVDTIGGQPTILVYFRGSWCPYCVKQLKALQAVQADLVNAGYQLVAIAPEAPETLAALAEQHGFTFTLMADPQYASMRAFGLTFALDAETRAAYEAHNLPILTAPDTDDWILPVPAIYLVDHQGRILYRHLDRDYRQRLDAAALVAIAGLDMRIVEYRDGDEVFEGFLAAPRGLDASTPGVLVIHEWWGVNDYARRRTVDLAAAGYVAFAGDMYGQGQRAKTWEEAAALSGAVKKDRPRMRQRTARALHVLKEAPHVDASRLAVMGYCFGGTCALELARAGDGLAGAISFHGALDAPLPAAPDGLRARLLICHGADDPYVPPAEVNGLIAELTAANADWQLIHYGGAVHSFTNPEAGDDAASGAAYHAPSDRRSWSHLMQFLSEIFEE